MKTQVAGLISSLIDAFLKGEIDKFVLRVDVSLNEEEFKSLLGSHQFDEKHTYTDDKVTTDEYEYIIDDTFEKKIEIQYVRQDNKIFVFMIKGYVDTW